MLYILTTWMLNTLIYGGIFSVISWMNERIYYKILLWFFSLLYRLNSRFKIADRMYSCNYKRLTRIRNCISFWYFWLVFSVFLFIVIINKFCRTWVIDEEMISWHFDILYRDNVFLRIISKLLDHADTLGSHHHDHWPLFETVNTAAAPKTTTDVGRM